MLHLLDVYLTRHVRYEHVYSHGLHYIYQDKVHNFVWNEGELSSAAYISGSEEYYAKFVFNSDSSIHSYGCTCSFIEQKRGVCKHLVALFKATQSYFYKEIERRKREQEKLYEILDYFSNYSEESKTPCNLTVVYEFNNKYSSQNHSFSIKIGENKQYIVKNIRGLIDSFTSLESINFGKGFTFDPVIHYFKEEDQPIIQLIQEAIAADYLVDANSRYYTSKTFLSGKNVALSEYSAKRLFEILQNKSFDVKILDQTFSKITILQYDLPISFSLDDSADNSLSLKLNNFSFIPLTSDCEYVFANGNIYHQSKEASKHLPPFANFKQKIGSSNLILQGKLKDRFIKDVLPYINQDFKLEISDNLKERFLKEELECKIYLDKIENQITCRVFYHYGSIVIPAFDDFNPDLPNDTIILRNITKEKQIVSALESAEFLVAKGYLFIEDTDKIIDFVTETLPHIQQLANIFYSDSFKSLRIADNRKFKAGVRYTEGAKMFEINFDFDGIEKTEIRDILSSYRLKKKYHKLKNGEFIKLDGIDIQAVDELISYADINERTLSDIIKIPISRALYVNNQLQNSGGVELADDFSFKKLVDDIKNAPNIEYEVPSSLENILRDYQKVGFKWLKTLAHYKLGGILADDMGLGKTLQAICFIISEMKDLQKPSLVIAPTSLLYNWQDEINKFAPFLNVLLITGDVQTRQGLFAEIEKADIVVTSYPLIRRDIELYEGIEFAYCFLDEAQQIKNPESINAKSVKQIRAMGYFALTGTPIENSLTEMWSIFDFVMPGFLLSHNKFVSKYERPIIKDSDPNVMEHLSKQIRPFVLRRMKKDVLKELPEKIETKITAELTEEQKKIYLAYLEQINAELAENKKNAQSGRNSIDDNRIKILSYLTRLRQICCHPATFLEDYNGTSGKLQLLNEIVESALESGHRILLFSQFTSMLSIIKELFVQNDISYFYLDGNTKIEDRHKMVNDFNAGENQVFLISLKAGGTGLNLTGADMVIHYDPWWNPAVEDQATDRAYRIGQENVVQVIKLVTKGTIEEKIFKLQERKKQIMDSVIQPGETMISKMTAEEIESLFEL